MTKRKSAILIAALLLIGFIGYQFAKGPRHIESNKESATGMQSGQPQQAMPVTVARVEAQDVQLWHEFSGNLVAVERVNIRTRVPGAIDKIYFEPGQIVEKGQKLFLIDPRPYQAAVAQGEAQLATARAQASLAGTESERAERLIRDNAISQREYAARTNATRVAQANIQAAQAVMQQARLNLDYATITAPVRGRISRAEVTAGNLVDPMQGQVLAEIVSVDPIFADFEVDEQTYLNFVRNRNSAASAGEGRDMPIQLSLKNDAGRMYDGKIVSFDNQLDTASGTIRARAVFANSDEVLVPGMFATIHLGSAESVKAILLSDRVINTDQDKKFVYIVGDDNLVAYRPVTLGGVVNGMRIITDGLKAGEQIVTEGLHRLRPGMPVQPVEKTGPDAQPATPEAAEAE